MSDPDRGKYTKLFAHEYQQAQYILFDLLKLEGMVAPGGHDYEAWTYSDDRVRIMFYPHKTSAGNRHIRVRDIGSREIMKADEVMAKLDNLSGFNCTFSRKVR